ncbi:PAS domain-containing protein [Streptomyces sp. V4I8]|uniref:PAS domain-containing protein n=1 Tax=Streptomyces sp. V4I8 TaxID=3156469 RepID=UPI003516A5E2
MADALRGHNLVWLAGQEELARRYPQLALVLPYPFALGAAPITTDGTQRGGLVLHWPGSRSPQLRPRERDAIGDVCRRLGSLLRDAADSGHPVKPGAGPCLVPPPGTRSSVSSEARFAVDFAERLPGGCCGLDGDGRITFATTTAMELLGAGPSDLLGARPWEALPWLNEPVAQDRYRAAVLSRGPTSFTALRPPDRWLSFRLYPNASGISVRIVPAPGAGAPPVRPPSPSPPLPPPRAGQPCSTT